MSAKIAVAPRAAKRLHTNEVRRHDAGRGNEAAPAQSGLPATIRVVLIGTVDQRRALRARLSDGDRVASALGATASGRIAVAAEFATVVAARASAIEADAILMPLHAADSDTRVEEPLTPREIDVLELLAEGLSNKAIAQRLGISAETVKFHVSSVCGKLAAANRTEAVRLGIRRGLITV